MHPFEAIPLKIHAFFSKTLHIIQFLPQEKVHFGKIHSTVFNKLKNFTKRQTFQHIFVQRKSAVDYVSSKESEK